MSLLYLVSVLRCQRHSQQQYSNHIIAVVIITKSLRIIVRRVRIQNNVTTRGVPVSPASRHVARGNAGVGHVAYCGSGHVLINIITHPVRLRKHGNLRQTTPREHQD